MAKVIVSWLMLKKEWLLITVAYVGWNYTSGKAPQIPRKAAACVVTLSFKINKTAVMIWKPHLGKTLRVKTEGPSRQSACWVAVAENSGKVQSELSHPLLWDTSSDSSWHASWYLGLWQIWFIWMFFSSFHKGAADVVTY